MLEAQQMKTKWQTKKEISFCRIQILAHSKSNLMKWDYIPEVTFQAFGFKDNEPDPHVLDHAQDAG